MQHYQNYDIPELPFIVAGDPGWINFPNFALYGTAATPAKEIAEYIKLKHLNTPVLSAAFMIHTTERTQQLFLPIMHIMVFPYMLL